MILFCGWPFNWFGPGCVRRAHAHKHISTTEILNQILLLFSLVALGSFSTSWFVEHHDALYSYQTQCFAWIWLLKFLHSMILIGDAAVGVATNDDDRDKGNGANLYVFENVRSIRWRFLKKQKLSRTKSWNWQWFFCDYQSQKFSEYWRFLLFFWAWSIGQWCADQ